MYCKTLVNKVELPLKTLFDFLYKEPTTKKYKHLENAQPIRVLFITNSTSKLLRDFQKLNEHKNGNNALTFFLVFHSKKPLNFLPKYSKLAYLPKPIYSSTKHHHY